MGEQKLRKFRLIDKEGYVSSEVDSYDILELYSEDDCFTGYMDSFGDLVENESGVTLILDRELPFFEEILFEEEDNIQQSPTNQKGTLNNDNKPPANKVYATFSDEMIHCIKEDCHAVDGSLCFYKEGVVFLWNEDEYFIESVDDYYKVINSIKVLNSFKRCL